MPETTVTDPAAAATPAGIEKPRSKRARKPRASKPAADKPKRERAKPRTLAAWLREQGPHYVEAARVLGPEVREKLRADRAKVEKVKTAYARVLRLEKALAEANRVYDALNKTETAGSAYVSDMDRLDTLARQIAAAKGETVEVEEPNSGADIDAAD